MKLARLAWELTWGACAQAVLGIATLCLTLAVPLALELGIAEFQAQLHDAEGKWLGADLALFTREPIEELASTPCILETIVKLNSQALHLKVSDAAGSGAIVGADTAVLLKLRLGEEFAFGETRLRFQQVLGEEPDRLVGLPSGLPRLVVSHAAWEASGLGSKSPSPQYRYLFFDPPPGKKRELFRKYPGAMILSKEDSSAGAEINSAQVYRFLRAGSGAAVLLGLVGIFLLSRLRGLEERFEIAKLKICGATPGQLRRIGLYRILLLFACATAMAIPITHLLIHWINARLDYFSPFRWSSPNIPPAYFAAWLGVGLAMLLANWWAERIFHQQRPATLLLREAYPVSALQRSAMLLILSVAVCCSSGLGIAYREFVPSFLQSNLPSEAGVLVIGEGPPAAVELQTVWVRVQAAHDDQAMGLATCSTSRQGLVLEEAFARRVRAQVGSALTIAVGQKQAHLRVEAIKPERGVAQHLRQLEIPCALAAGLRSFRLAWHPGPEQAVRQTLPRDLATLSAEELRGRVADLVARSIFFPQLCAAYVAAMALLICGATWRMVFLQRRSEVAIWRVCGATRGECHRRLLGPWRRPFSLALFAGALGAWAGASYLLQELTGTRQWAAVYWIPVAALAWGVVAFILWHWQMGPILRERPGETLRAR